MIVVCWWYIQPSGRFVYLCCRCQLRLGRQRQMVHSVSGWTRGVQVTLWDPLRTRAIPERLRGVFTTRRYTNTCLPLPYLTLTSVRTVRFMWRFEVMRCLVAVWVAHWVWYCSAVVGLSCVSVDCLSDDVLIDTMISLIVVWCNVLTQCCCCWWWWWWWERIVITMMMALYKTDRQTDSGLLLRDALTLMNDRAGQSTQAKKNSEKGTYSQIYGTGQRADFKAKPAWKQGRPWGQMAFKKSRFELFVHDKV